MPTEWWLRPVNSAARVGEQRAVVWKRLYFSPPAASRSAFGVWHGPPNALDEPKPASSIRMSKTFGAPSGGRSCSIGGLCASGSFASYIMAFGRTVFGIGRCERCFLSCVLILFFLFFVLTHRKPATRIGLPAAKINFPGIPRDQGNQLTFNSARDSQVASLISLTD